MPEVMAIRVLIVDDEPLVRGAFRALLESSAGHEVVAEARDGARGSRRTASISPTWS
ncbi:response regulator [Tessaracoccus coleopterorum]|uniref:hypothetical protein n=1 Tax=Tessaracoccus coleopterorum TaxID=2714950 RepID=UPI0018D41435|nr:hypothetical protein [Tessaracoccus coleopterorum]